MPILNPKQPGEVALYVLDLALALKPTSDTIESHTLAVTSGTITIGDHWADDHAVYVNVAGGANSETAALLATFVTSLGQTLKRSYTISISNTAVSADRSTSTKQQLLDLAFEEIGLAGYEFDATDEEKVSALRRLDALMAEWNGPGFNLPISYNFPAAIGGSSVADATGVPDFAFNTVGIALALALMPVIGKAMSSETRLRLTQGMNAVRAAYAQIPNRSLPPSAARGAGAKPFSTWTPYNGAGNGAS